MDGILNIRKESGPTSHDVVGWVRRILGQKKVGHAGTLDPMATGVLVVCLGKATRIVEYLMGTDKQYRARMVLGEVTDTADSTGELICSTDASSVTRQAFEQAAAELVGDIMQVPPMVSALKRQGRPLYKLAREGKTVERAARSVTIYSIEVISFTPGPRAEAEMTVCCSSGTYIRTICSDIGDKLGCGGHMSMLDRERVGRFCVEDSVTLDELQSAFESGRMAEVVTEIGDALTDMPAVRLDAGQTSDVLHGIAVEVEYAGAEGDTVRILGPDDGLIALAAVSQSQGRTLARPRKVLLEAMDN